MTTSSCTGLAGNLLNANDDKLGGLERGKADVDVDDAAVDVALGRGGNCSTRSGGCVGIVGLGNRRVAGAISLVRAAAVRGCFLVADVRSGRTGNRNQRHSLDTRVEFSTGAAARHSRRPAGHGILHGGGDQPTCQFAGCPRKSGALHIINA